MGKSVRRSAIILSLVVLMALMWVAAASASSATNAQVTPGFTTRTVWDSAQVAVYKLPYGVNHNGAIHMEVQFKPNWADLDIYLLNSDFSTLSEEEGYMAAFTGREVIDFAITGAGGILNKTIETDPYSGEQTMVGDPYYVVIVAFNDTARYQVWGYYPQIDLEVGPSTTNQWNYYLQPFRMPAKKTAWKKISGAIYGYPYDFKPTSLGEGVCELEWPADVAAKTVSDDISMGLMPANLEQYLYGGAFWDTIFEDYGDGNWLPPAIDATRYGLHDTFTVQDGGYAAPQKMLHYVPSVYLIASDPAMGPFAEPKLGTRRMGYKATIVYPENLRLVSGTSRVRAGGRATIRGSFALNAAWAAGAKVTIQRQTAAGWAKVKTVTVGATGKWTAKFYPRATTKYRAMATGDPVTGLATEYSVLKRILVTR